MVRQSDIEANGRASGDTRTENQTYQSTILPASAIDFDPEPHKRLFRQFANPAPLGLCGFALTTFVLSLINVHARKVVIPNIIVGLALAYGGFAQFCAGMWEFACGNTFGALAFTSYGAFWISFAVIFIPFFNVIDGYATDKSEFGNALGHYLICWFIFTLFLCIGTIRSSVAFFGLFFTLTLAFLMLAIGSYLGTEGEWASKTGGWFGLVTAMLAWYNAVAALWNPSNSFIKLPLGQFPWAEKGHPHVGHKSQGKHA